MLSITEFAVLDPSKVIEPQVLVPLLLNVIGEEEPIAERVPFTISEILLLNNKLAPEFNIKIYPRRNGNIFISI